MAWTVVSSFLDKQLSCPALEPIALAPRLCSGIPRRAAWRQQALRAEVTKEQRLNIASSEKHDQQVILITVPDGVTVTLTNGACDPQADQ